MGPTRPVGVGWRAVSSVLAVGVSLMAPALACAQPLTKSEAQKLDAATLARRVFQHLTGEVAQAYPRIPPPIAGVRADLDAVVLVMKPHASLAQGVCERQRLTADFVPTAAGQAQLAQTGDPWTTDPEVTAQSLDLENQYLLIRKAGDDSPEPGPAIADRAACASPSGNAAWVRAPDAYAAWYGWSLVDDVRSRVDHGGLPGSYRCIFEGQPCPDARRETRMLTSAGIRRIDQWRHEVGGPEGERIEAQISGDSSDDQHVWTMTIVRVGQQLKSVILSVGLRLIVD